MRKVLILTLLLLGDVAGSVAAQPVLAGNQLASIKEALSRSLCYELYWQGQSYRANIPLPLELKIEQEQFFAWIDGLKVTQRVRMSGFFIGRVKEGKGFAVLSRGYNLNLTPQVLGYAEDRRHFENDAIKDTLTIPTDCTPRYDPPTPQKERMLQTVVSTMQKQLSSFVRMGAATYPQKVTLTIANFNIDYPSTYILVEPPGHLYTATLHNPQNYESDEYEREGEYPLGEIQVKPHLKPLLAKIRKHGIIRKITLTP